MNIAKKKKVQSWSWLCDCEVCSPKCIEQRDRQASWRVTLSAGVKEPPSLSVGWENTKYHRSVCSHVHSCRLVLMRPLVSKCLGKEQPLKLNECHNIKILLNQWHCFQALCAISFSKWWNTLTQGCHHFLWSLWQQPLHSCSQSFFPLIAPAKNSSHCFSMETLFFQRIIVPATATPHFSYSHCFCKWKHTASGYYLWVVPTGLLSFSARGTGRWTARLEASAKITHHLGRVFISHRRARRY